MTAAAMRVTPAQVWIRSQVVRVKRIAGSAAHLPPETNRKYTPLMAVSKKLIATTVLRIRFQRPLGLRQPHLPVSSFQVRRAMLVRHFQWIARWITAAAIMATPLQVG